MRRSLVLLAVAAIAVGSTPAHAAAKKKKHPDWKGSYSVTLYPDPTEEVMGQTSAEGCNGLLPSGKDVRPFTVPAAGKLTLTLVSPDPTGKGLTDWDLWEMDANREPIGASHGATSNEQIVGTFKKKTTFNVEVCNLIGNTAGTVSWVFKYA